VKQKFDSRQPSLFEDVQPAAVQATVEAVSGAVEVEPGDWRANPVKGDSAHAGLDDLDQRPFWSSIGGAPCSPNSVEAGRDVPAFRLVPHATFLAWPESVQWRYCAARDRASAAEADNEKEREWYLQRAETYEQAAYNAPVPF
jgi:hypothetical protein